VTQLGHLEVSEQTVLLFRRSAKRIKEDLRREFWERRLATQRRVHLRSGFAALCGVSLSSWVIGKNSPAYPAGITCKNCLRKMHRL
jgi:hypothetical protein